jgi:hypothetical protein
MARSGLADGTCTHGRQAGATGQLEHPLDGDVPLRTEARGEDAARHGVVGAGGEMDARGIAT